MIAEPTSLPIEDPADPVHGGRVIDWDDFDLFREEHEDGSFDS